MKFDRYKVFNIVSEVAEEMSRQFKLWGIQNHPNGTGHLEFKEVLDEVRDVIKEAEKKKELTWNLILLEEVSEALAEEDPEKLRTELIQVAAVASSWVQAIDRKKDEELFRNKDPKQLSLFAGWEK